MSDRYVVLGVAAVRSPWFRELGRWATSSMLPIEFVKAISVEEVRVRLRAARGYSALLVDDSLPGLDRDLIELATDAGCAVLVVDSGRAATRWMELGAAAVLEPTFGREELLAVLEQAALPIARRHEGAPSTSEPEAPGFRGALVAVTGPGGTGASTVAIGLAQGLAADPRHTGLVCLADFALDAEQAMLNGAVDVVPGVVELVDAHRRGRPSTEEVRALTWHVVPRGYQLLLGVRQHRDWTAIRPRTFAAALDGLRRGFRIVVADVDADLEGERTTGSLDIEERNTMARTTMAAADLVLVVGRPGLKGVHSLLRTTRSIVDAGVPVDRIIPVLNRAPRNPRARAEAAQAFGVLLGHDGPALPSPLQLAERRHLEDALRDRAPLPGSWVESVASPVRALLERTADAPRDPVPPATAEPVAVRPGELGSWADDEP